ncbi:MAG: bacteriohemerythrin [Terracidiphilus sp.]
MGLVTWSRVSSVGVRAMDQQHGVLEDTLNDLRQAAAQGSRARAAKELERLVEFTRQHFTSEERLLEQMGFPALAEHRAAHAHLLERVERVLERTQHRQTGEMQAAAAEVRGWFAEHIEQLDQNYGEWLNERGIV